MKPVREPERVRVKLGRIHEDLEEGLGPAALIDNVVDRMAKFAPSLKPVCRGLVSIGDLEGWNFNCQAICKSCEALLTGTPGSQCSSVMKAERRCATAP